MTDPPATKLLPAPNLVKRSRTIHWVAWLLALAALALLGTAMFVPIEGRAAGLLAYMDLGLSVVFAFEFFTRSGWRTQRARYLRWRWFDFIAMVPGVLGVVQGWPTWTLWVILVCRVLRALDRTLGDGFVLKQAMLVVSGFEEEISDRVVDRVLVRWQAEIGKADFGHAAADALLANRAAILDRIYEVQLKSGTLARLVNLAGLRSNIEKEEAVLFDEIVAVMGSAEVDKAIRDVVDASFESVRTELGRRTARGQLGTKPTEVP